jgi:hypothetical protein
MYWNFVGIDGVIWNHLDIEYNFPVKRFDKVSSNLFRTQPDPIVAIILASTFLDQRITVRNLKQSRSDRR